MTALLITSLIWAISFGLIGNCLAGIPSDFIAMIRMAGALIVFTLFIRKISLRCALTLLVIGGIQFGGMYLFYLEAFKWIPSYQVALFTAITPIYIILINSIKTKTTVPLHLIAALLAVIGGIGILWKGWNEGPSLGWGFLLVQLSNLCFAGGQIAYASLKKETIGNDEKSIFAYAFIGALLVTLPSGITSASTCIPSITLTQWSILAYLGIVASGLCFFLWNYGARRVTPSRLAVMNNLKIPLAAIFSISLFGEHADWHMLLSGCILISAGFFVTAIPPRNKKPKF